MQIVESELENINEVNETINNIQIINNNLKESLDIPLITFIYNYCNKYGIKYENDENVIYEISKDNLKVIINDYGEIKII